MRNYEMRKTNNELTLKKIFFLMNNKWREVETLYTYIYIYMHCRRFRKDIEIFVRKNLFLIFI